jgi:hypothetical protein
VPVKVSVRLSYDHYVCATSNVDADDNDVYTLSSDSLRYETERALGATAACIAESSVVRALLAAPTSLACGARAHPINCLRLTVSWPNVNEDVLVENGVYSDLQPASAPFWSLQVSFHIPSSTLMAESLSALCSLAHTSAEQTAARALSYNDDAPPTMLQRLAANNRTTQQLYKPPAQGHNKPVQLPIIRLAIKYRLLVGMHTDKCRLKISFL